jgi:ribosomal-protein-alanine N-acetyltransferase
MNEGDLAAVLQIEKKSYSTPWPAGYFWGALRAGWSCWILEQKGEIRGYGVMRFQRDWAHIMNVCVAAKYRGHGLGRQILVHLLEVARVRGTRNAWLEVRPTNQIAINLYRSLGFRRRVIRKGYYPGPGGRQDAIVMVRPIRESTPPAGR